MKEGNRTDTNQRVLERLDAPIERSPIDHQPASLNRSAKEYHAQSSPKTNESAVKQYSGSPKNNEAIIVPPRNQWKGERLPNCPKKHIKSDSIQVMYAFFLLFLTLSHTNREEMNVVRDT